MSEEIIIRHCSPTLAGLKTGNIFNCSFSSINELRAEIRALNKRLSKKGIRVLPLRISEKSALVYVYRPKKLCEDFMSCDSLKILENLGYNCEKQGKCILRLIDRLKAGDFPHEIGLFLGYPPEDVKGFIENEAKTPKITGCWKVYGDEQLALSLWKKYKKCTEVYTKCHSRGSQLERLAVAAK